MLEMNASSAAKRSIWTDWPSRFLAGRLTPAERDHYEDSLKLFEAYFVPHLVVREWIEASDVQDMPTVLGAVAAALIGAAWLVPKLKAQSRAVIVLCLLAKACQQFPAAANHFGIEIVIAAFFAVTPQDREAKQSLFSALCLFTIVVLFHSGLQKVLYGTYFHGSYIATRVAERGFGVVMGVFAGSDEIEALAAMSKNGVKGPFLFRSPLALIASNMVYITEVALAIGLTLSYARRWAAAAGIVFIGCIEAAALELSFGLLMINLLLIRMPPKVSRPALCVSLMLLFGLGIVAVSTPYKVIN